MSEERPNLAHLQVWKKNRTAYRRLKTRVRRNFVTRSRRWKVTSRLLHVEEDKYSRRKVCQLRTRARWVLQLEEFDYEIEHRAGSRMKHVDALRRYPVIMVCNDTLTSKLKKAQEEDDNIQTLKLFLGKQESEKIFERNGVLYKYLNRRELIVALNQWKLN
ncbi:uncharacterized protein TNCV_2294041 [Trichonephila clavipes]|nr:uncharacterized protein TNCV_2294041 [Trichonephila clavipes]